MKPMRTRHLSAPLVVAMLLLAAPTARAEGERPPVAWKDGKTTLELGGAQLNLSNRIQIRFTETDFADGTDMGSFRLRRARTSLDGWLGAKDLRFELMVDWVDSPLVQDLNFNWDATGRGSVQIKGGQFKVPFGRQELTSDTALQFVDRSIVSAEFEKGRDQGIQVWGQLPGSILEYRLGVFNGGGRGRTTNDNSHYQQDARFVLQPLCPVGGAEGDLDWSARPCLALGVNAESNDTRADTGSSAPAAAPGLRRRVIGGDMALKFRGFSGMVEVFKRRLTPVDGTSYASDGHHAQIGYFVIPRRLELALRWASWDPSSLEPRDQRTERGVAVSAFSRRRPLKLQADYREIQDQARRSTDREVRCQVQFVF